MTAKGFAVIYRWTVAEEHHQAFRARWHKGTLHLKNHGWLGSCRTRDGTGDFVAIALWPSEAAREAAFSVHSLDEPWPPTDSFEETKLEIEDDLWASSPFSSC